MSDTATARVERIKRADYDSIPAGMPTGSQWLQMTGLW